MTTTSGVAVVATQLAHTDRRALSQAWYSALHLERDESARVGARSRVASNGIAPHGVAPAAARSANASAATLPSARPTDATRSEAPRVPEIERRRSASEATRRVERAVTALARRVTARSSHTVTIDGARVTLVVRSDARTTRVVAVCSMPLRATVERALAHARFALAVHDRSAN